MKKLLILLFVFVNLNAKQTYEDVEAYLWAKKFKEVLIRERFGLKKAKHIMDKKTFNRRLRNINQNIKIENEILKKLDHINPHLPEAELIAIARRERAKRRGEIIDED